MEFNIGKITELYNLHQCFCTNLFKTGDKDIHVSTDTYINFFTGFYRIQSFNTDKLFEAPIPRTFQEFENDLERIGIDLKAKIWRL